jgi:23S rRNA pseudouridine2605 synthase
MSERLSKFLACAGISSRRKSAAIISSGRVKVNGIVVDSPSHLVTPGSDVVTLDGVDVKLPSRYTYIALYKPVGYLSDLSDPRGRKVARSLITLKIPLFPVGRLDYNSEGLMLFTNDGEFANHIMHPRFETEKEYIVKLSGKLTMEDRKRMLAGIYIDGDLYRVLSITLFKEASTNAWYRVILTEGKNRMIRKLAKALEHPVLRLKRIRIDGITLTGLQPGQYRHFLPEPRRDRPLKESNLEPRAMHGS